MPKANLLKRGESRRIYALYEELKISPERMAHIKGVNKNLPKLRAGKGEGHYTPASPEHLSHFTKFLSALVNLLEQLPPAPKIIVDTAFNYFDFNSRPPFLDALRKELISPKAFIKQEGTEIFSYGNIHFKTEKQENATRIIIFANSFTKQYTDGVKIQCYRR